MVVAAVSKLRACDPTDSQVLQWLERLVPGRVCELTICVEILLGLFLLFGDRGRARLVAIATGAACAIGNLVLLALEGNVDCGCLRAYGATHAGMVAISASCLLLSLFGRKWGRVSGASLRVGAWFGLALAVVLGVAGGRAPASSDTWWPRVATSVRDGDVVLFGASACDVCSRVALDGRLLVDGREVGVDRVVLVHRESDRSAHAGRFRAFLRVPDPVWWAAIGRAAPAAYRFRDGEVAKIQVQNVHAGR